MTHETSNDILAEIRDALRDIAGRLPTARERYAAAALTLGQWGTSAEVLVRGALQVADALLDAEQPVAVPAEPPAPAGLREAAEEAHRIAVAALERCFSPSDKAMKTGLWTVMNAVRETLEPALTADRRATEE